MSAFQDPQGPINPNDRVRLQGRQFRNITQRRGSVAQQSEVMPSVDAVPTAGRDLPQQVGMPSMPAQEPQPTAAPAAPAPTTPAPAPTEIQQPQPQVPKFELSPEEMANPEFMSKWEDMTTAKKMELMDSMPLGRLSDVEALDLDDDTKQQIANVIRGGQPQEDDGEGGFLDWMEATASAGVSGFLDWIPNTLSFFDEASQAIGGGIAEMIAGENVSQSYGSMRRKAAGNAVRQVFEGPDGRLSLLNALPSEAVDSIKEAQARHPLSSGIAQGVGTIASFMVPGGQAKGLGKIGQFSLPGQIMKGGTIASAAGVNALARPLTKSAWAQGFKTAVGKAMTATPVVGKPTLATSKYIAEIAGRHGANIVGTGLGSAYAMVVTGDQKEVLVDRALTGMAMGAAGYTGYAIANKVSGAYINKMMYRYMSEAERAAVQTSGNLFKSGMFTNTVIAKAIGTVIEGTGNSFFDPNIYPALGTILNSANETDENVQKALDQITISATAGYIGALIGRAGNDPAWATLVTRRPDLAGAAMEYDAIALETMAEKQRPQAPKTRKQTASEAKVTEEHVIWQREQQAQEQARQEAAQQEQAGTEAAKAAAEAKLREGMPLPGEETLLVDALVRAGFRGTLRNPNYGVMMGAPVGGHRIWVRNEGGKTAVTINGDVIRTLVQRDVVPDYLPDSIRSIPPDRIEAMASFTLDGPDVPQFLADLGFLNIAAEVRGHTALSRQGGKPLDVDGLGVYGLEGQQYSFGMDGTVFVKNITDGKAVERPKSHAPNEKPPVEDLGIAKKFEKLKQQPKMPIDPNEHSRSPDAQAWVDFSISAKARAMADKSGRLAASWRAMESVMYLATYGDSANPYVVQVNKLFEMMPRPSETLPQLTATPESFQRLAFVMGSVATGRMTPELAAQIVMGGGPEPTPGGPRPGVPPQDQGPSGRLGEQPPAPEGQPPAQIEAAPPRPTQPGGEAAPTPEAAPQPTPEAPAPEAAPAAPKQRTFMDLMGGPREVKGPTMKAPEAAPAPEAAAPQAPEEIATAFSGAGTMEAALTNKRAGVVAEFDPQIVDAYNKAYGTKFNPTDVANLDPKDVAGKPFHASPVCKNFSAAKSARTVSPEDLASGQAVAKIIDQAKPPSVTIENAPEYVDSVPFKEITDALDRQGYNWEVTVVDAADLGASQRRKRMILRAVPEGVELPPLPEKKPAGDWYKAIEDLIPAELEPLAMPPNEQKVIDERVARGTLDPNKPILSMGGNKAFANAGGPAPTLVASPKQKPRVIIPGKGMFTLTPRMMARLMGLPDSYKLPDNPLLAKTVLGNGIQGEVTKQILEPVMDAGLKAKKAQAAAPQPKRVPPGREGEMGSAFIPSGAEIAEAAGRIGRGIASKARFVQERVVQLLGNEANFIGKISERTGQKLQTAHDDERRIGGELRSLVESRVRAIDSMPNAKELVAHAEDMVLDPKTGGYVNRLQNAHEGLGIDDLNAPAGFKKVVDAYHDVVVESGRKLEEAGLVQMRTDGTLQRFTANEARRRFLRMGRPELYQVLARPTSKAFEKLVDVLAKGNNLDPKVVAEGLNAEKKALNEFQKNNVDRKIAADFSRSLDYFPAAIEVDGQMIQLLESDLQANLSRIADDTAIRAAVVKNVGNNISKEQAAALNVPGKEPIKVMEDTYAEFNEDLKASGKGEGLGTGYTDDNLRAVMNRVQNLYTGTFNDPSVNTLGRVATKIEGEVRLAKLTLAATANLVEPVGSLPQYVGFKTTAQAYRNVLKDAAKVAVGKAMRQDVHMQTRDAAVESGALVTGVSARAFDSNRFHGKAIDALRLIASGGFEKTQAFAEIVAAEAGRIKVETWRDGRFRASDEVALRSLDFTPEQIEAFRSGTFDDALGKAFIGRMAGEATSSRVGARKALLTSSKRFNLLFPFNRYFLGRMKSAARAALEVYNDPKNPAAYGNAMRLLGGSILGGTLAMYLMRSTKTMDPIETAKQMFREMTAAPATFATDQARSQLAGGPLMSTIYDFGNPSISDERALRAVRPIQIYLDARQAWIGTGPYRGMTKAERFSSYFSGISAIVPTIETAASLAQLDEMAEKVKTIKQNVNLWARKNNKVRFTSDEPVPEEVIAFRKSVRESVQMLNTGKDLNSPEVKIKIAEAMKIGPGENLRQAIRNFKVLVGRNIEDDERTSLLEFIGKDNYATLIAHDQELETLAQSIPTDTGLDDRAADFKRRLNDAAKLFAVNDMATIKSIKEDLVGVLANGIAETQNVRYLPPDVESSLLQMASLMANYPDSYDAAFGEITGTLLRRRGNRVADVMQTLRVQAIEKAKRKIKEQARGR